MRNIKVCIIAKYLFPYDTRLSQQVHTLEEYGIPCDIICSFAADQKKREKLNYATIFRVTEKNIVQGTFFIYLLSTFKFILITFLTLLRLSLKNKYQVIIVHTLPEFLVFSAILNKLFGTMIILDGRDLTVDLLDSRWSGKKVKIIKRIAIWMEKWIVWYCDHIITASNGFRQSLINRGVKEDKVSVLINTADVSIFRYDKDRLFKPVLNNARLLYHGTVSERFGILVAVKAMKIVCEKIPGSELHIYGWYDLDYRKKIEQYIQSEKLEGSIYFGNPLPLQDIYKIIKKSDMGIVPYLSDNFMNIALSTKSFEYIASGLPVVASRLRSAEEIFDSSCVQYAIPGNPENLAENIIQMCFNPEIRSEKRENAFSVFNEQYTSMIQSRKYIHLVAKYLDMQDLIRLNVPEEVSSVQEATVV